MTASRPTLLAIDKLRRDGGTQPRDHISPAVAQEYAEALADGDEFPPVTAFFDGTDYWVADGFHRILAHELIEAAAVAVDVRQGDRRDAVLFSVGANAAHGYRRTSADKRRAVLTLLNDPEWAAWSDREIARRCAVSHPTVSVLRPKASLVNSSSVPVRTFTDRHGNESTMRVAAIGRTAEKAESSEPETLELVSRPMESAAPTEPPVYDHATASLLLDIADTFERIAKWPSVETVLDMWRGDIGAGPDEASLAAAVEWLTKFVVAWPAVAASRETRINEALEGA